MDKKLEVICSPQEGRTYYSTTYTEKVGESPYERYFTTNPLTYVGKYTGSRADGWGINHKEWSYFINEQNEEIIVTHELTTAFYHKEVTQTCMACKQDGHRIHTCPDAVERQSYFDAQKKEIVVLRTPIEGKYYDATFWTRREGDWPNEKHYTKETNPREFAGKYLRHKQEGWGDGGDHWAIFLRDGKEIEIEYDYDGKRAWYEVGA